MTEIPRNLDAEIAIIGAALCNPKSLQKVSVLQPQDFSEQKHKRIWTGILSLLKQGKIPDPLLLKDEAPEIDLADLAQAISNACIEPSLDHYIGILRDKEKGRRLYFASRNVQAAISDGVPYDDIEAELLKAMASRTAAEGTTQLDTAVDLEAFLSGNDMAPFTTFGIQEIDTATGGIRGGEICILAARTSIGKSAVAVLSTFACACTGWNPLYLSYEMPKRQLWNRFISYQSRVFLRKFRDRTFNQKDIGAIKRAELELRPIMRHVSVNTEANTPGKITQLIRMEQLEGRADFVIVDHAGRMKSDDKARNNYEKMSSIANELKDIAINLNVPILVLWQLRRGSEDSPTLDDLRDSGQAEEVADTVILLNRNRTEENPMVDIDIAKARDGGQLGVIQVPWKQITMVPYIVPTEEMGEEVTGIEF
ncbi:MAG TPA: hypothetical protein DCZ10_16010 [Pelotomaculum sp.]|nr:hypothetical protein [Pelotomaculum sp.]